MSNNTSTRSRRSTPTPKVDALAFRLSNDPTFVQAVNRAANLKCLAAIKSGRLRVVQASNVGATLRYSPRMDLVDDPSASRVVALFELPGIKSSDITLQIRENNLVITGTRTPPTLDSLKREFTSDTKEIKSEEKDVEMETEVSKSSPANVRVPIQELRYGSFYRAIRIPDDIQESDVSATLHEGMLKVTWPRVSATHIPVIPTSPPPSRTSSTSPNPGHPSSTNNASQ